MNITLLTSRLCSNLDFTNFGNVGECFVETTLFGDVVLAGLILSILFVALLLRYNFSITMILPVGLTLMYILWIVSSAEIFLGFLILGLIIGGAVMIIALINYINR